MFYNKYYCKINNKKDVYTVGKIGSWKCGSKNILIKIKNYLKC